MKNIISIVNNEIRLDSGLTESAFAKTNYSDIVNQQGILAECDSYSPGNYHFTFSPWTFNEVKSYKKNESDEDYYVFYCANNIFADSAAPLTTLFEAAGNEGSSLSDKDRMFEAAFVVCSILTQAAKENASIPKNGAGGILIELNQEKTKVLFLPERLFNYSIAGLSAYDYSDIHGCWINATLSDLPALCFMRGVMAYKMLTGRFPYTSSDQIERNADILDRKFLPIELSINGINGTLAANINKALKLNSNAVTRPGKKQKGKSSEDLTPSKDFPLDLLYAFKSDKNASSISDKEFMEKSEAYLKKQNSIIKTKRNLRRNTAAIITTVIILTAVGMFINSIRNSRLDAFTSKGLTSTQTITGFYYGVNQKDTVLLGELVQGHQARKFTDSVGQIYVISKQRQAYYHDMGFQPLEGWLLWATSPEKDSKSGIYGVTNMKIDGKPTELYITLPKNKEKPLALTEEKGVKLTKGTLSVHSVEYYLVHTEDEENNIYCEKIKETVTLTYKKDRWYITGFQTDSTPVKINSTEFKQEYFNKLKENDMDILKTVSQLKKKYDWLPGTTSIKNHILNVSETQTSIEKDLGLTVGPNNN